MAKLIWGIDPLAVSRLGRTAKKPPFTKKELARIGIPAHKIPREKKSSKSFQLVPSLVYLYVYVSIVVDSHIFASFPVQQTKKRPRADGGVCTGLLVSLRCRCNSFPNYC